MFFNFIRMETKDIKYDKSLNNFITSSINLTYN